MICSICQGAEVETLSIPYPLFTTLNYLTIAKGGQIGRCCSCQTLFQCFSAHTRDQIEALLKSSDYAGSSLTSQTFTVPEFDQPVTRSFLQAELMTRQLSNAAPAILDIGAFDGQLLLELNSRLDHARLHGFDVNPHLKSVFPARDNFRLWLNKLEAIDERFDLICMSHSIMYEERTGYLMEQVKRLIKPDGILYIQVPDITANPCILLLGDQYFYYTPAVLTNTCHQFGFSLSVLKNPWFPREIVGIARPTKSKAPSFNLDRNIYRCVEMLDRMASRLSALKTQGRIGVLGTTINAAFAGTILDGKVGSFFDENPNCVGTKFRGKDVLHPKSLQADDLLIIPYGESGHRIRERFAQEYQGEFLVI